MPDKDKSKPLLRRIEDRVNALLGTQSNPAKTPPAAASSGVPPKAKPKVPGPEGGATFNNPPNPQGPAGVGGAPAPQAPAPRGGKHPDAKPPEPEREGGATFVTAPKPAGVGGSPASQAPAQSESAPASADPLSGLPPSAEHLPELISILDPPLTPPSQAAVAEPTGRPAEDDLPPGAALWKYVEVSDPADRHTDSDCRAFDASPGLSLFGARVRGRTHKNEGTNCDDWFEVERAGDWEIIAVSDGAGSCSLSRIGAEISTKSAIALLRSRLAGVQLDLSDNPPLDILQRDEQSGVFEHPTVEQLQQILHEAVLHAVDAVRTEAEHRHDEVKKFSSTLRLAIHRLLPRARGVSFLMACCVGDGMTAAVDTNGKLHLLGLEKSGGAYSGETEFLTDPRFVTRERLVSETFVGVLPVRAVMVMTDGIADPYYPNHAHMLRLYADLILNGVLDITGVDTEARTAVLQDRGLELPNIAKYSYAIDTPVGPAERMRARIRQSDRFASELKVTLDDLLRWPPALLLAGAPGEPMNDHAVGASQQERLRIWLDAFYVKTHHDDRTLVILHREAGS